MASSSRQTNTPLHQETSVGRGLGQAMEVDNDCDIYESSPYSTATPSVASSIFNFVYANGRRYHSEKFKAQYLLPNDEAEQERLDLYHHIFSLILDGKLHTAPLENPQRVLDVGTGTGIWAIDFADEYPKAEVIGTDISPIQPNWIPPNCRFEIDDMESPWIYSDDSFDYIHIRSMSGSFKDWPTVLAEAYKKTKPGGIVEFQDYSTQPFLSDGTRLEGVIDEHPISSYAYYLNKAFEASGYILDLASQVKELFIQAGFVDVVEQTVPWPIGRWPKDKRLKEIGTYARIGSEQALIPFGISVLKSQGWTEEQVRDICNRIKESYSKGDRKGDSLVGKYYCQAWFIYGRKPDTAEKPKDK